MEIAPYHNLGRLPEPRIHPQILLRRRKITFMTYRGAEKAAVPGWEQSKLWAVLQRRRDSDSEGQNILSGLRQVLEPVQILLQSSSTSPRDFTLHDAAHAFRVAEMMTKLVPADVAEHLSLFELALLLMSAYCHDIGMMPSRCLVLCSLV